MMLHWGCRPRIFPHVLAARDSSADVKAGHFYEAIAENAGA